MPIKMENAIQQIASKLTSDISELLSRSGIMFRIFSRVKTENSIRHKLEVKYAEKKSRVQDMIGIRIVTYFQDDIDALALYYSVGDVVKKAVISALKEGRIYRNVWLQSICSEAC